MKFENFINLCLMYVVFKPLGGLLFSLSVIDPYVYTAAYHSQHRLRDVAIIALDIILTMWAITFISGVYSFTGSTLWTLFSCYMALMALGEIFFLITNEKAVIFPAPPY